MFLSWKFSRLCKNLEWPTGLYLTLTYTNRTRSCVSHCLITHIFIFIESRCYRKRFWSKGWNGLFRLLKEMKCTRKVSLPTQKNPPLFILNNLVKQSQTFSLKLMGATRGKSIFALIKHVKVSLEWKGKWLLICARYSLKS